MLFTQRQARLGPLQGTSASDLRWVATRPYRFEYALRKHTISRMAPSYRLPGALSGCVALGLVSGGRWLFSIEGKSPDPNEDPWRSGPWTLRVWDLGLVSSSSAPKPFASFRLLVDPRDVDFCLYFRPAMDSENGVTVFVHVQRVM